MRTAPMAGLACVLGLGLAGCKASVVSESAIDGGLASDGSTPETGAAAAYTYVFIRDREFEQPNFSCSASDAPGTDIDTVGLIRNNTVVGYTMKESAAFTPENVACAPTDCAGENCKYASSSTTFSQTTLVSWTEGPPDAVVNQSGDDSGFMSLNGGSLQFQIGDLLGNGPAQTIRSGDQIKVFEVDPTPAHYQLWVQNGSTSLQLNPAQFDPANSATCGATPAPGETLGCGTTVFAVP
ncbi:MAG: hypothetical protein WBP56_07665 [Polyangia bacterium]